MMDLWRTSELHEPGFNDTRIAALVRIGDPSAVPSVRALAENPKTEPHLRLEAVEALGSLRGPGVGELLLDLMIDPVPAILIGRLKKKKDRPLVLNQQGEFDEKAVIDRYNKRWPLYDGVAKYRVHLVVEMEKDEVTNLILQDLGLR